MSKITVPSASIREGDVVLRVLGLDQFEIERAEPDPRKVYRFSGNFNRKTLLIVENGFGYWHAYEEERSSGRRWPEFAEHFGIDSPEALVEIGTNTERSK